MWIRKCIYKVIYLFLLDKICPFSKDLQVLIFPNMIRYKFYLFISTILLKW
jgi:hypothetical protein